MRSLLLVWGLLLALLMGAPAQAGVYVALSNGTSAVKSSDGTTWTAATTPPASANWSHVTFFPGKGFVAVSGRSSASTAAAFSVDGDVWQACTMPASGHWYRVECNNAACVALTQSTEDATATTTNGCTWSAGPALAGAKYNLVWTGSLFVTVRQSATNSFNSSDNGTSWNTSTSPGDYQTWSYSAFSGARTVIWNSSTGATAYTTNGTSWSASGSTGAGPDRAIGIAYGNGTFSALVFTAKSTSYTSTDSAVWASNAIGFTPTNAWTELIFGGGLFVAAGTNQIATSTDGKIFTSRTISAAAWQAVAYGAASGGGGGSPTYRRRQRRTEGL